VQEQRCPGAGARLGEQLRRHHPEREAGQHQRVGQPGSGGAAPLEQDVDADLLRVGDTLLQVVEHPPLEQVGQVHDVPGPAQHVPEGAHSGRQPVRGVEDQHLGHVASRWLPSSPCRER
jgi:hypothetical protein